MAVSLWLNDVPTFVDQNGEPLSGAWLYFYLAGSSTKENTFTDSSGVTPNANPMQLDSAGRPQQAIWLTTGTLYKVGLAAATEPDPPNNFIWEIDNVSGIPGAASTVSEWIASGFTPTYVSGTSFTVPGDQTSVLTPGRAVQIIDGGGTKYGHIATSVFTTLTTVVLDQNSQTLANPVASVAYGILQGTNTSAVPISPDDLPIRGGSADRTKQWHVELDQNTTGQDRETIIPDYDHRMATDTKGADVVCAATLDLSTVTGSWCDVTGSTGPVTAVTLPEGRTVWTRTVSTPQFNNGASLVLLTGANIVAEAGDWQCWKGYAAGVVRMVAYTRANGQPVGMRLSAVTSLSGTAINFSSIPAGVKRITIPFFGLSTNGTSVPLIQIGDSGSVSATGYLGSNSQIVGGSTGSNNSTVGFSWPSMAASSVMHGFAVLQLADAATHTWVGYIFIAGSDTAYNMVSGGRKVLSGALTNVRLTMANGTDVFDAGSVSIQLE